MTTRDETGAFRRRGLAAYAAAATFAALSLLAGAAAAQDYPAKPITMLVGYAPGGQTDLVGRGVARVLSDQLGVPVNVVNKPGAGGALAASELQKAEPDGYTMLVHSDHIVTADPFTTSRINFKPDDFEYAGKVTAFQQGLAAPKDAPYDTLAEFVDWARENPGAVYGSLSPLSKMYMDEIARKNGLKVNMLPLKSGADVVTVLLGKQASVALSGGIHYRYPDEIKTIVATTTFRHASAPDVETIDEAGYPLGMDARTTLFLPKGTPRAILEKVSKALKAAETDEEFEAIVAAADIPIMYMDLDAAAEDMRASYARNKAIFEGAGITPQ